MTVTGSLESYVYAHPGNHRDAAPEPVVILVASGNAAAVDLVHALEASPRGPVLALARQIRRQINRVPAGHLARAFLRHHGAGHEALERASETTERAADVVAAILPGEYDRARAILAGMTTEERTLLLGVARELSSLVLDAIEVHQP